MQVMGYSNKVSISGPTTQLKKQNSIQTSEMSCKAFSSPFPSPITCDPSSNYFYNSFDFFIVLQYISLCSIKYIVFNLFKGDVILCIFCTFSPSTVFLRFMHGLQSQTFWVCIQSVPRNCWVVLSKLLNHFVLHHLFCKIGRIIIVPTIGLLE